MVERKPHIPVQPYDDQCYLKLSVNILSSFVLALPKRSVDVIFATGGYGFPAYTLYKQEQEIIRAIVDSQGTALAKYGLIQYGDTVVEVLRKLSQFIDNTDFKNFVRSTWLKFPGRGLVLAMEKASDELRSSVSERKALVLFANRIRPNSYQALLSAARKLAIEGVKVVVVFSGSDADSARLRRIVARSEYIFPWYSSTDSGTLGGKIALQLFKGT